MQWHSSSKIDALMARLEICLDDKVKACTVIDEKIHFKEETKFDPDIQANSDIRAKVEPDTRVDLDIDVKFERIKGKEKKDINEKDEGKGSIKLESHIQVNSDIGVEPNIHVDLGTGAEEGRIKVEKEQIKVEIVYIYLYMYIDIYIYTDMCIFIHMCISINVCISISIHICISIGRESGERRRERTGKGCCLFTVDLYA
jgi:hypothetical protein